MKVDTTLDSQNLFSLKMMESKTETPIKLRKSDGIQSNLSTSPPLIFGGDDDTMFECDEDHGTLYLPGRNCFMVILVVPFPPLISNNDVLNANNIIYLTINLTDSQFAMQQHSFLLTLLLAQDLAFKEDDALEGMSRRQSRIYT